MKIVDLQNALATVGYYKGKIDGHAGNLTAKAVDNYLTAFRVPGEERWGPKRKELAAMQLVCKQAGIEVGTVDGLHGPQTTYAFEVWNARLKGNRTVETWRDNEMRIAVNAAAMDHATTTTKTNNLWPRQGDVPEFYGDVGKNQRMISLPYIMRIAWDKSKVIERISVHEKVADSCLRAFTRIERVYTHEERQKAGLDLFGGALNVRKMRGGSAMSMHSWGIALDFDPERNQLKWGRDKARLAQPDCDMFWKIWEEEGWVSLGRARNYDWMHVQAARL